MKTKIYIYNYIRVTKQLYKIQEKYNVVLYNRMYKKCLEYIII